MESIHSHIITCTFPVDNVLLFPYFFQSPRPLVEFSVYVNHNIIRPLKQTWTEKLIEEPFVVARDRDQFTRYQGPSIPTQVQGVTARRWIIDGAHGAFGAFGASEASGEMGLAGLTRARERSRIQSVHYLPLTHWTLLLMLQILCSVGVSQFSERVTRCSSVALQRCNAAGGRVSPGEAPNSL